MASISQIAYPPPFSDHRLSELQSEIQDWQLTHGSLIKVFIGDDDGTILARPIGVSMFPTLFPKSNFEQALQIQESYNELYAAIAEDEVWLSNVLSDLIESDPFARALWKIHQRTKREGACLQPLTLGIFRSDYMLHCPPDSRELHADDTTSPSVEHSSSSSPLEIKQVEINTFSCAGGTHGNIATNMHHHLNRIPVYQTPASSQHPSYPTHPVTLSSLPSTNTIASLVSSLAAAHTAYGPPEISVRSTAILMIVQPNNINICDERPIEYGLWSRDPPVPCYRAKFPLDILTHTEISPSGALLYYPPNGVGKFEISVAYMRAGYDAEEHDIRGIEARVMIEGSHAIKCPSVLAQLATFKKVQQALSMPGAVERFLPPLKAERVRATFAPMYALDESELGLRGRELAKNPDMAVHHVLKPSLEGGGHNIYRADIPRFLEEMPEEEWRNYVLMEMIRPPKLSNVLLTAGGTYKGGVVSELGVFGTCLWKKGKEGRAQMVDNKMAGWSFKTKAEDVDEMSVVKGYGCFDTPCLVDC
ncbi:glutathione synthetase [Lepidopterella palustris CBS 459.81]|uniref:Glutathione synthetase n=1 Tax=Lepidopterella palustris CBS 459.81 TaxID=1314670 RepID=A0A8E2EFC3_9PEZI|nr:glutathione synthetase [Lepidopterella palustris CBS 459.81]